MSAVAIFGPGLIGGSLALALRSREPLAGVTLWARSETSAARIRPLFSSVTCDVAEAARDADICVLCTPIGAMPDLARQLLPHLRPDAVVTDAGSVKGSVVDALEPILGSRFVGSHPMAGSEKSGFDAAYPDLFDGAACILTPTASTSPATLARVSDLWKSVGCRLLEMSPSAHDEAISRVSHLPHTVAALLVNAIALRVPDVSSVAGGGYRDSTRIAAGPAGMWSEILLENRGELIAGLDDLAMMIAELKDALLEQNQPAVETILSRAKSTREHLL